MRDVQTGLVDAVTFDYWNTLCYEPEAGYLDDLRVDAMAGAVGADLDDLRRAMAAARDEYWAAWRANRQFTAGDAADFVLQHLDGLVPGDRQPRLVDAFHAASDIAEICVVDGVADALTALRERGVRLGIVCDVGFMASRHLRRQLERRGLLDLFDHWSFSDEVGVFKPSPRIFEHALAGLGGVEPVRAAHVGDRRRTDVAGAQGMGMRAVRLTAVFDDDDPDEGPPGDAVIGSYEELLPALGLG